MFLRVFRTYHVGEQQMFLPVFRTYHVGEQQMFLRVFRTYHVERTTNVPMSGLNLSRRLAAKINTVNPEVFAPARFHENKTIV